MKLTDEEILQALNHDGDNMQKEYLLRDARIVESLVNQKTHIVWITNTGVIPKFKLALLRFYDDICLITKDADKYDWDTKIKSFHNQIKEYAIIDE